MHILQNDFVSYTLDEKGSVCSVFNKKTGHEYCTAKGELFRLLYKFEDFEERPVDAKNQNAPKISVDGNSMSILYTEAPLEITIAEGNHHIVVEGGRYGDARIDRNINFDILDVWTVDMPGADDADVIRHQMISSSEYRSALSSSGFRVTRKTL